LLDLADDKKSKGGGQPLGRKGSVKKKPGQRKFPGTDFNDGGVAFADRIPKGGEGLNSSVQLGP